MAQLLNPADTAFETRLRAALPDAAFRPPEPRYFEEPRGLFRGQGLVVAPGSTAEVAAVLRAANAARVGVVPYGGGTGLVGGQIAPEGPKPVVLSLERMNRVRAVYPLENTMIIEAGATLAAAHEAAAQAGRLYPLSLASEGSCQVGGTLATNAGGVNVLRYGNARELCFGLEAVLADGTTWHGLKRLRKDNTGYDLRGLLIGSEGTLGVITAAALRLFPRPKATAVALISIADPAAALALLSRASDAFGPGLTAFELISGQGLRFLQETDCPARIPFSAPPDWSVLIELSAFSAGDPQADMLALFEAALEEGAALGGVVAQSETQAQALWQMREMLPEANKRIGAISSHDISVPIGSVPEFLSRAKGLIAKEGAFRINAFGHLGDGNLHFNLFAPPGETRADYAGRRAELAGMVYDLVTELDGSISAEHGIGRLKAQELATRADPAKYAAMQAIKAALDPNGILNPGAVLRKS
ncbi:MAG: hydroxyacid dehydrogenase [Rhodobacterales bacterium]|nr:MAG: hydroxyacid dehydrogenase [Rhodobacterales bacterium]